MSRTKQMPDNVKQNCICLVKGYARRREEYQSRRRELTGRSSTSCVAVHTGAEHQATRTTEEITRRILALEERLETRRMRAVEYATERVGLDLGHESRNLLRDAVIRNCIDGRKYPFERLYVEGMERSCFYDRRRKFLYDIAKYMEMI